MAGESDGEDGESFQRQSINGKGDAFVAGPHMQPCNQPDHQARDHAQHQMQQQDTLELLTFKLELPGQESGNNGWDGEDRSQQEVEVSSVGQAMAMGEGREKVEGDCRDEERDWKMYQHDMLCVFGEEYGFGIEGVQAGGLGDGEFGRLAGDNWGNKILFLGWVRLASRAGSGMESLMVAGLVIGRTGR